MKQFRDLLYEKSGPIAKVTLNRPEVLNAFTPETYSELKWALVEVDMDEDIQIVVITGAGRAFSTGGDIKGLAQKHLVKKEARIEAQHYAEDVSALCRQMESMDKIVIAAVNGTAQAGGLILVLYSDITIASDQATFGNPAVLVGLADGVQAPRLPSRVGMARAKYLILTGEVIDAYEAERIGLINKVVPHGQLWSATLDIANKILRGGPYARAAHKHMLNATLPELQFRHHVLGLASEEAGEGCRAFAEKRKPSWSSQAKYKESTD